MPEQNVDTLDLSALPFWQWDTASAASESAPESILGLTLDSLLPVREVVPTIQRPSIFRHHALQRDRAAGVGLRVAHAVEWVAVPLL